MSFGLARSQAVEYLTRPEPLAWALAALMDPGSLSRAENGLSAPNCGFQDADRSVPTCRLHRIIYNWARKLRRLRRFTPEERTRKCEPWR